MDPSIICSFANPPAGGLLEKHVDTIFLGEHRHAIIYVSGTRRRGYRTFVKMRISFQIKVSFSISTMLRTEFLRIVTLCSWDGPLPHLGESDSANRYCTAVKNIRNCGGYRIYPYLTRQSASLSELFKHHHTNSTPSFPSFSLFLWPDRNICGF